MPPIWIRRTLEDRLSDPSGPLRLFPVWLLLGPRQVGKSSLLRRCGPKRRIIDLDDLDVRARANQDPELFMRGVKPPLIVDEIQYAPKLLSPIKRLADRRAAPGAVWLTSSQNFTVMEGVRETLAGRVALLNLLGLSDEEKGGAARGPAEHFRRIVETGFPRLRGVRDAGARELFLSSYVKTYIERDIRELLRVEKRREFEIFVKMCALRTAQVVNYEDLARDCGVSAMTVKEWLSLLEDSFLVKLIYPYHANKTKRLIKSPKLYFLDMGLAAHLAGWRDPEALRLGPMGGAALETHVVAEIWRGLRHRVREAALYFWRTRDGQEIDLLVEAQGRCYPIEVKMGRADSSRLPPLRRIGGPRWERGQVASLSADARRVPLNPDWDLVPLHDISLETATPRTKTDRGAA